LIAGGHHAIVLPLMQGFVGQRAFTLKKKNEDPSKAVSTAEQDTMEAIRAQDKAESAGSDSNFLLTLISRRSVKRPGLRYLRYRSPYQDPYAVQYPDFMMQARGR